MPKEFARPTEGFNFNFGGLKTNDRPDAFPRNKYPVAVNIRAYSDNSIRTRPGLSKLFDGGTAAPTDMRAYTALGTGALPRLLMRDTSDKIWLDNGVQVGTLAGSGGSLGAVMIPFRPGGSPNPYMYIANGNDYQKFSSPDGSNNVTQQKVGIAEPQNAPDALILALPVANYLANSPPYTNSGTAGAVSTGTRVSDTITTFFQDPNNSNWSVAQVTNSKQYQRGMEVDLSGVKTIVEDVFPALAMTLTIVNIYYFSGNTGRCMITVAGTTGSSSAASPAPLPPGGGGGGVGRGPIGGPGFGPGGIPRPSPLVREGELVSGSRVGTAAPGNPGVTQSVYGPNIDANLRRGSLLTFAGGTAETAMVLSVTQSTGGAMCIEMITTSNHTRGETLSGQSGILVIGSFGTTLTSPQVTFAVTTGVGQVTATLPANFFVPGGFALSLDDYFHASINIDNLLNLTEAKILIDIGDGSFTQNYLYYTVRPSDLVGALGNAQTQLAALQEVVQRAIVDELTGQTANNQGTTFTSKQSASGTSQWSEILFNLGAFTRVGSDQTKSLQTATKIQFQFNASGTVNVAIGSVNVTGGASPDVGDIGAPYRYRIVGRSSITQVRSNSSPATRYGVTSRRNPVQVWITQSSGNGPYDAQIDTWDIYRYGGTVPSWRYVGSINADNSQHQVVFTDNFDDSAAEAGDALELDNFEPWPSISQPFNSQIFNPISTHVSGNVAVIDTNTYPYTANLLPGTLFTFQLIGGSGGTFVLTLRKRPTLLSSTVYLFEFEESLGPITIGVVTQVLVNVYEPIVANQHLPYMWGPDVNGTVFAVGDQLRPGTLYFSKGNVPDSAPDNYNIEIVPPSEPLMGGEVLDGLSFVASTQRWWALYPQPQNPLQRYNFVQQPFTRGLIAPLGHCNDGRSIYWWAKDGIYSSTEGCLTSDDLYKTFPHDGVPGETVTYNGVTVLPPDYSDAEMFRLVYSNGYLYAIYTSGGVYAPILVYDTKRKAWSVDAYQGTIMQAAYAIEQPADSNLTLNPVLILGGSQSPILTAARIFKQRDLSNDNDYVSLGHTVKGVITASVGTAEFDGGDVRAPKQWGDFFVDCVPASPSGLSVTPMSLGVGVAPSTVVPQSSRIRTPVSVGGVVVSDFMGLFLQWADDFTLQTTETKIYLWQPSFDIQPARDIAWSSFGTSFGLKGFQHLRQINLAWVSTAPVTLTVKSYDGQDPLPIVIPSSGGKYQKAIFPFSANKGLLFDFSASSAQTFQIFNDDSELYVGEWGRPGAYNIFRGFGGREADDAPI